ncbi:basic proline-rich protein-like [Canis lupus familiaris]|uniref:basic proline-rich protein-like n=1 Tax=Canis lupus familiaris TaxID=9615 RepID=UPI0018F41522|nr:basic proline-rich protein-like [Canis lupus familiaris]
MLTTIPPTLHSPGRPGRRPRLRTSASSPSRHRLRRLPQPAPTCRPAAALRRRGRHQRPPGAPPAPPPRSPGCSAGTTARASAARLWGALSPPCGSRALGCPPGSPPLAPAPPGSRAAVRRVSEEPVAASLPSGGPGWAGPSPHAPGRQGARADEEGQGVGGSGRRRAGRAPRSPRASGRTGPGGGTREEKEDKEEKEEKEGPGGRRTFGQRGGGARDQKRACLASPSGNHPVSRVTGGDTHHYTNEEAAAARADFRRRGPACLTPTRASTSRRPSCQAPATCPGPRPTRPAPRPPRQRAQQSPGPTQESRAPRAPQRGGEGGGEKSPKESKRAASERDGVSPGGVGSNPTPDTPTFGPPNAGSPHPGLDDAVSRLHAAAGCGLGGLRAGGAWHTWPGTHAAAAPRPPAHRLGARPPPRHLPRLSLLLIPRRPRASATRQVGGTALRGLRLPSSFPPPPPAGQRGPKCRQPRAGRATLPLRGAPRSPPRSQPRPTPPPPARRERGVPTAGSRALRAPARDGTPARSLGPRGGGGGPPRRGGSGEPERKAALPPRAPSAPEAAAGPGLQDASALPHRARPPASQPAAAPPKRTCRPHPHRSPAGPDGELRAELTRLSLASWLGRYSAAPISDDTDADRTHAHPHPPPHPRHPGSAHNPSSGPQPAPAGAHCTGRRAIRPWALGGAGREGKVRAELRRPQTPALPGNRARVRLGQAAPPGRTVSGGPAPGRGRRVSRVGASLGVAPRGPSPSPSPSPSSAHLHGRGACLADRGPAAAPAQRCSHWPCRDDDERRWGSRLVAAATGAWVVQCTWSTTNPQDHHPHTSTQHQHQHQDYHHMPEAVVQQQQQQQQQQRDVPTASRPA